MPSKFDSPVQTVQDYGEQVIAPILVDYVEWVLEQAKTRGLKRLYFLARDGHILQKIAISICKAKSMEIECRYLYCSRYALRSASYDRLSQEEVLSFIGLKSIVCSPDLILERCHLTEEQRERVALACNVACLTQSLDEASQRQFVLRLRECPVFWSLLKQESKIAYEATIAYFRQERLLEGDVAVVDSGWSGSIQRSLGQLLRWAGFSGRLEGFYFGMYLPPKSSQDGTYHTFYFDHAGKLQDKAWFNNNLFECMLAAPHGMTVGYEEKAGRMVPILREKREQAELALVKEQEAGILLYVLRRFQGQEDSLFEQERLARCRQRLRRCMVHPTTAEVQLLSSYRFCDDSTEGYLLPLAEKGSLKTLNTRLLPVRILRRLIGSRLCGQYHPFVWYYGAVVGAPLWLQPLYRWNEFLWECVRLSRL